MSTENHRISFTRIPTSHKQPHAGLFMAQTKSSKVWHLSTLGRLYLTLNDVTRRWTVSFHPGSPQAGTFNLQVWKHSGITLCVCARVCWGGGESKTVTAEKHQPAPDICFSLGESHVFFPSQKEQDFKLSCAQSLQWKVQTSNPGSSYTDLRQ